MIDLAAISAVPLDRLEAVAGPPPSPPPSKAAQPSGTGAFASRLDVGRWLTARGVAHRIKPEPDGRGRTVYVLAVCPFHEGHVDPDACVMQAPDGQLSANCFHDGCSGRGWQAFKQAIGKPDPDHYDPPLQRSPRRRRDRGGPPPDEGNGPPEGYEPEEDAQSGPRRVIIDPSQLPVAETMRAITGVLLEAGECYQRAEQVVRIAGTKIHPVLEAAELAGLLNAHAEVQVVGEESCEFKPLPSSYGNSWLKHPLEPVRLPAISLFSLIPVFTRDWRIAPPGYDAPTGIYSAGPVVTPAADTRHLDALLADFCFRTDGDRTNYLSVLVTAVLGPHFVGSKPALLLNGNQPGLGKSVLAQIVAIVRDGRPVETATYNPNDEEFEKRLGALVHRGVGTLIVDNAKASGRSTRIDSAVLERSITDPILSYRLLGYSESIRAENSHQFILTANTASVSRDLVTRSAVVNLLHEGDPARRTFTLADPEEYALDHREILLGELLGMVVRWREAGAPLASAASRFNKKGWGPIVGGILAHAGYVDFLANATEVAADLDETRRDFGHLVAVLADHPQGTWTAGQLAELALGEGLFAADFKDATERARATKMGLIAGRYVGESFPLPDDRVAHFGRTDDRKGSLYHVRFREDG